MTQAFGYSNVLIIEKKMGIKVEQLESMLSVLKKARDEFAHQHRPSVASTMSPRHIKAAYFEPIYAILLELDSEARLL